MRFLILVKADKSSEAGRMPSAELLGAMAAFNAELVQAGVLRSGDGLHPTSKGARVRFEGGRHTVVPGPFTPAEEQVAGFWIWECKSQAEAIEWVKRCPPLMGYDERSVIEVRQIFEAEDFPAAPPPELSAREQLLQEALAPKPAIGLEMP